MRLQLQLQRALLALSAAAVAAGATNIESDGFSLDGSTTYCMGIGSGGSAGSLTFDSLLASNAGRCPVGVSLSLSSTQVHVSSTFTVSWTAAVDSSVSSGIFPNAIDASTGLPGAVQTSLMWACTSGTNCATNVAGAPANTGGSASGAFGSDGSKQLEDNAFTLTTEGSYILVGLVQLPGDSSLDISAEEYLIFETITVVSADTVITPTPSTATPASASGSTAGSGTATPTPTPTSSTSSNSTSSTAADLTTTASGSSSSPATVKPSSSTSGDSTSSEDSAGSSSANTSNASSSAGASSTVMIIAVIAAACVICVIGFVVIMRRRKESHIRANKAYDLGSPNMDDMMGGAAVATKSKGKRSKQEKMDLGYVANISARNTDRSDDPMLMSDDTVVIMASAERGSELAASSSGGSIRHPSSDHGSSVHQYDSTRDLAESHSVEAGGAFAAAAAAPMSPSPRASNISELSSLAPSEIHDNNFSVGGESISNYGDSVVDESQQYYLQSFDWKESQYGSEIGEEDDKGRGYSTASGFSEFSARDTSLSEGRASTVGGAAGAPSEYRPTDFSDATRTSRLDSEVSVDSYSFRPSRESTDSYGSGMSMYSRQGSRISGMSNFSDADSTK